MWLLQILKYGHCHKWLLMDARRCLWCTKELEEVFLTCLYTDSRRWTYLAGWSTTDLRAWMCISPTTATWWTSGHYHDKSSGKEHNLLVGDDRRHWVNDQQLQHLPPFSGDTVWCTPREAAYTWLSMADHNFRSFWFWWRTIHSNGWHVLKNVLCVEVAFCSSNIGSHYQ